MINNMQNNLISIHLMKVHQKTPLTRICRIQQKQYYERFLQIGEPTLKIRENSSKLPSYVPQGLTKAKTSQTQK
jgi:hypothetical protein